MFSVCMAFEFAVIRSDWSAGPRPYMEDRYTIISSYTPLSFTSQAMPDDIVRSYAAVFDGHNGTKAAEHACARHAPEPARSRCVALVGVHVAATESLHELQSCLHCAGCIRSWHRSLR